MSAATAARGPGTSASPGTGWHATEHATADPTRDATEHVTQHAAEDATEVVSR